MGKSISANKLQHLTKLISTKKPKPTGPITQFKARPTPSPPLKLTTTQMESSPTSPRRQPLADVVADCVKRWFEDALKEAKAGDVTMQVLVGQMYSSGYGVGKDEQKGRVWISKAARSRSSALKVGDKRPGYNASDSDSEDVAE